MVKLAGLAGKWGRCAGLLLLLTVCTGAGAELPVSTEVFLKICANNYGIGAPQNLTPTETDPFLQAFTDHLDETLSVYLNAIMNKRYYDNVVVLLCQESPLPLVEKSIMLQPFAGPMMIRPELAKRYPLAERMAFLNMALKTSDPLDRGAYHAVAKGKEREIGALRDWVKANGKLDDPLTQEAIRVLAEVDLERSIMETLMRGERHRAKSLLDAEEERAIADDRLQSSDKESQFKGLSDLIRLGIERPDLDVETLWAREPLRTSPVRAWERENKQARTVLQKFVSGESQTAETFGRTEYPAQVIVDMFQCDAWEACLKHSNASLRSLMDGLAVTTNETASQYLAAGILWIVFPDGTGRPKIPYDQVALLARFADKYVSESRNNKLLLPACMILYFPFLRKLDGFETQYKSAWDLYTQVVQSDQPGLRCRALVCLGWEEGRLPTPEGDMVRKAVELEMQYAAKDGDFCHIIAAYAAASNAGVKQSGMPIGATVP